MSGASKYYNGFYRELACLDAKHNSAKKIDGFVPKIWCGMKVLDIGCGYGTVSSELVVSGCDVYGMELNRDCVEQLKRKGFNVIEQDFAEDFRLDRSFDLVLLLDVMEHTFDPLGLLERAAGCLTEHGMLIVSVPLYFDLVDRIRILFTGRVVSYDNLGYGRALYSRFRSYNYDHIRFFRPYELLEMAALISLQVVKVRYVPISLGRFLRPFAAPFFNTYTASVAPGLLAHSMMLQLQRRNASTAMPIA